MTSKEILIKELSQFLDKVLKHTIIDGEQMSINKGVCFTTSMLGCKLLRRLGYDCTVERCSTMVVNPQGRINLDKQFKTEEFDKEITTEKGGWAIGIGEDGEEGNGHHYVIIVKSKEGDEVIDLTIGQSNREKYGIKTEPFWRRLNDLPETIYRIFPKPRDKEWELTCIYYSDAMKKVKDEILQKGYKLLKKGVSK